MLKLRVLLYLVALQDLPVCTEELTICVSVNHYFGCASLPDKRHTQNTDLCRDATCWPKHSNTIPAVHQRPSKDQESKGFHTALNNSQLWLGS